jgi:multicomponent Na+:H+ antiporter subunit E
MKTLIRYPVRIFWFICYAPLFIWECLKANMESAYIVAHPDLPIRPGIVRIRTSLKSNIGLTFLANSLTLKPGTMAVDTDKKNGILYVHWANVKTQDGDKASAVIARRFEYLLKRIFG